MLQLKEGPIATKRYFKFIYNLHSIVNQESDPNKPINSVSTTNPLIINGELKALMNFPILITPELGYKNIFLLICHDSGCKISPESKKKFPNRCFGHWPLFPGQLSTERVLSGLTYSKMGPAWPGPLRAEACLAMHSQVMGLPGQA